MYGNGSKLHEGIKLHEDKFAPRVIFYKVTILHESKKNRKINIKRNRKKPKRKIEKKEKSYWLRVRVRVYSDSKKKIQPKKTTIKKKKMNKLVKKKKLPTEGNS